MTFFSRLEERARSVDSILCVGLDPHPELLPEHDTKAAWRFCMHLIDETSESAAAFKPNIAFFEALGPDGLIVLSELIEAVPDNIPVIIDAKRGDIGSTAEAYARAIFDELGADAVTVNAYLGEDSVAPFLARPHTGVFVLARTSNPGAAAIQDELTSSGEPVHEHVVRTASRWAGPDRLGFVVGATAPSVLSRVRRISPESWIMAPGVGAQGAALGEAIQTGIRSDGLGLLLPVARALAAVDNPATAAVELNRGINAQRLAWKPPADTDELDDLAQDLFDRGCLRFGDFQLKSGTRSPIYVDLRRLASHPETLTLVARAMHRRMEGLEFDHVAAIPYAAIPIGTAIALQSGWSLLYPRREVKDYGTKAAVEGDFSPGQRAVVIDDLATTGDSKLTAIAALNDAGIEVHDIVVLIDRQSGAAEALEAAGHRMHAVLTLSELVDRLHARGLVDDDQRAAVAVFLDG